MEKHTAMGAVALGALLKNPDLLPYGKGDIRRLRSWMRRVKSQERDLALSELAHRDHSTDHWLGLGVIVLQSGFLDTDILLVKEAAGTNLFGRQRAAYRSYIGSYAADEWMIANTYRSLRRALAGIGNLYVAAGAA